MKNRWVNMVYEFQGNFTAEKYTAVRNALESHLVKLDPELRPGEFGLHITFWQVFEEDEKEKTPERDKP